QGLAEPQRAGVPEGLERGRDRQGRRGGEGEDAAVPEQALRRADPAHRGAREDPRLMRGALPGAILAVAVAAECGGASSPAAGPAVAPSAPTASAEHPAAPLPEGLTEDEKRDISVFRRASSSVVFITNYQTQVDLFTFNQVDSPQGSGSGFVWDREG